MSHNLTDAHRQFIKYLVDSGRSQSTVLAYGKDVEQIIEFIAPKGKQAIDELLPGDVEEFKKSLQDKRYTSKSIARKLNSVKAFFRYLIAENMATSNPAETVIHPKIAIDPPKFLSKTEYRALRDASRGDTRMFAIIELLLQTGMRISELAELRMEDIDFDRNTLFIRPQASRESRKVPLNKSAKTALQSYLQIRPKATEIIVFLTKSCRQFLVRNIRSAIDRYFRIAGIREAKVNDLRHTFIIEQLKAGTPLVYVSQLVGHKRITTTEKYLRLIEGVHTQTQVQIEEL